MSSVIAETELLPINPSLGKLAAKVKLYEYQVEASNEFLQRIGDGESVSHFVARRLQALSHRSKSRETVVSLEELDSKSIDELSTNRSDLKLIPLSHGRHADVEDDSSLLQRLIYIDLRKSIE